MTDITDHLAVIERRVAKALSRAGRENERVLVLAVSKGQPTAAIAAAISAGIVDFGENYVDEAVRKMDELSEKPVNWHFIGRVQSNKTRTIAERFSWIHTIDRPRIAERLNVQRPETLAALNALIQVNLAGESRKGGVPAADVERLADLIDSLPNLRLRGLMAIPPAGLTPSEARRHFSDIAALAHSLRTPSRPLDVLSMGMSGDFEIAVECGANCVRIGTALFGERRAGGVAQV